MPTSWSHYVGRCVDRLIIPLTPARNRLALHYRKHSVLGWEPESRWLGEYAPSGGIAVDAGANIGLWTYAMATSGLFRGVLAFEPNGELTGDLLSAKLPNVRVIQKALSSQGGVRHLRVPMKNGVLLSGWASLDKEQEVDWDDLQEILVETTRLDDEVAGHVSFLKIDVEGHELPVLDGARRTVSSSRPVCLIECRKNTTDAVRRWFSELGVGYAPVNTRARFGFGLSPGNVLFSTQD